MRLMNLNFCSEDATDITVSSEDANFPSSNLKHPFRSKRWRSTGVTTEWIVYDLQTAEEIDSVVLLWPKEDGIRLSNSATVTIQANATNVWTAPAVSQVLTINNDYELASHYFASAQSYRYWRLLIQDVGNPNGFVELGVLWLGKSISIQNAENGFEFTLIDKSKNAMTDYGHVYTDEYPLLASIKFDYTLLDYTAVQALENAFRINGNHDPVMVVLDADEDVFDKDHFAVYGKFQSSFSLSHIIFNIFNSQGIVVQELS